MKVLMTADAVGGVWTYALELIEGLADLEIDVVLAVLGPPPSADQRERLRAGRVNGYAERGYSLEWMDDPWADVERSALWLLELVDATEPDLVHLNGFALGALPLDVPKLVVGHSCVLSWHEAVRRRPAGSEWARYRAAVIRGIAGADALVAPTRAMLAELERLYRPRCEREVIPNGLDALDLQPLPKEPYVLGVGRVWDEAKNLAALQRVEQKIPWPVLLAGDGGPFGRVGARRLLELYGRAEVFAAPARYEPFGLSALEAGVAGCALVLGDVPSLREVWVDAALYVDPFDDEALAATLRRVIEDFELRRALGTAARRRALGYSRARIAAAYADLYERMLSEAPAEAPLLEVAR